jgi:hypothetical protein
MNTKSILFAMLLLFLAQEAAIADPLTAQLCSSRDSYPLFLSTRIGIEITNNTNDTIVLSYKDNDIRISWVSNQDTMILRPKGFSQQKFRMCLPHESTGIVLSLEGMYGRLIPDSLKPGEIRTSRRMTAGMSSPTLPPGTYIIEFTGYYVIPNTNTKDSCHFIDSISIHVPQGREQEAMNLKLEAQRQISLGDRVSSLNALLALRRDYSDLDYSLDAIWAIPIHMYGVTDIELLNRIKTELSNFLTSEEEHAGEADQSAVLGIIYYYRFSNTWPDVYAYLNLLRKSSSTKSARNAIDGFIGRLDDFKPKANER